MESPSPPGTDTDQAYRDLVRLVDRRLEEESSSYAALAQQVLELAEDQDPERGDLEPHGRLLRPDAGEVIVVVAGQVELLEEHGASETENPDFADFLCRGVVSGPFFAGLTAWRLGQAARLGLQGLGRAAKYLVLTHEQFDALLSSSAEARELMALCLEAELGNLQAQLDRYRGRLKDNFLSPNANMPTGSYHLPENHSWIFLMDATDQPDSAFEQHLPPDIGHYPFYLVVFSQLNRGYAEGNPQVRADYAETARMMYCYKKHDLLPLDPLHPLLFLAPELHPDNYQAIALGRELFGLPKRYGRTVIDHARGFAELEVEGRRALRMRWLSTAQAGPADLGVLLPRDELLAHLGKERTSAAALERELDGLQTAIKTAGETRVTKDCIPFPLAPSVLAWRQLISTLAGVNDRWEANHLAEIHFEPKLCHLLDWCLLLDCEAEFCGEGFELQGDVVCGIYMRHALELTQKTIFARYPLDRAGPPSS